MTIEICRFCDKSASAEREGRERGRNHGRDLCNNVIYNEDFTRAI